MKAILMSIRTEWCDLIIRRKKTVELRKTCPRLQTPFKVYIWCTKARTFWARVHGNGWQQLDERVIGEFICDDIRRIGPEYCVVKEDIESAISGSCLTVPQVKDYAGWKSGMSYADLKDLYGWNISDLKIYDEPVKLKNFQAKRLDRRGGGLKDVCDPPQSWFYVEDGR
jgi:predicted transcriptional regulator